MENTWEDIKMAKRQDLKRIMIIGSGPIVIGQAAEFDYAARRLVLHLRRRATRLF